MLLCPEYLSQNLDRPLRPKTAVAVEPPATAPRLMTGTVFGERVMNNFSLLAANRLTHLKVVMVALVCATLAVGIGFAARVTDGAGTATATVVKPGKPVTASASERRTIR